ncbi:hypothetical protein GF312_13005 [Candidatus Poribacteria bacterium]|nr:hypothetical protein [Candidatus Poribacteria bacterium]
MKFRFRFFISAIIITSISLSTAIAGEPDSIEQLIPPDSLAYISISNLGDIYTEVAESPQFEEFMNIEGMAQEMEEPSQGITMLSMMLGMSLEDIMKVLGKHIGISVIGISDNMPVAGLVIDTRADKESAEYAVNQIIGMAMSSGEAKHEDKEYRDMPYKMLQMENLQVNYAFTDNFIIAGTGGGFKKIMDMYKDGGISIKDNENYQFMGKKVSLSSNLSVFANLEAAAPMLQMMAGMSLSGEDEESQIKNMMAQQLISSSKALGISLGLSDQNIEFYLHVDVEEPNPITDMIFAPHTSIRGTELLPVPQGVLASVHLGNPARMLDGMIEMMRFLEADQEDIEEIEKIIAEIELEIGMDLKEDFLSALTGEFTMLAVAPEDLMFDPDNKFKTIMQMNKSRHLTIIGIEDREKISKAVEKLMELTETESIPIEEENYKGITIHTKVFPLKNQLPGLAMMPSYCFKDDVFISSYDAEYVRMAIDMMEHAKTSDLPDELEESRMLCYIDIGGMAEIISESGMIEMIEEIPQEFVDDIMDKVIDFGSVAMSFSLSPEGIGMDLLSTSDNTWVAKIMDSALVMVYVKAYTEKQEEMSEEKPEEWEE